MENKEFNIDVSNEHHIRYVQKILVEIESSAKVRGTGIARRSVEYIEKKLKEGKAIVATNSSDDWAGFCYIETWEHGKFVVN